MLFALYDYVQYRLRAGRYAMGSPRSIMGAAFEGAIPGRTLAELQAGDVLFLAHYGSRVSWPLMYLGGCEITHMALFVGDGRIVHQTLGGPAKQVLSGLSDPEMRFLPLKLRTTEAQRQVLSMAADQIVADGSKYDWKSIWTIGRRAVLGRYLRCFRWWFLPDVFFVLLLLDLPFLLWLRHPVVLWIFPVYVMAVCINRVISQFESIPLGSDQVTFLDMIFGMRRQGGYFLFDESVLEIQERVYSHSSAKQLKRSMRRAVRDQFRFPTRADAANAALIGAMLEALSRSRR